MVYYKQGNNELAKHYLEMAVLNAADYKGSAQAKKILHQPKQSILFGSPGLPLRSL